MLEEADAFGEVALLYDAVRTTSINSVTDGVFWKLDGIIFIQIIIESTQKRKSTELGFL